MVKVKNNLEDSKSGALDPSGLNSRNPENKQWDPDLSGLISEIRKENVRGALDPSGLNSKKSREKLMGSGPSGLIQKSKKF